MKILMGLTVGVKIQHLALKLGSSVEGNGRQTEISHNAYRSSNLESKLRREVLNFLVSKLTFLSNFMETLLIYVRHIAIWGFFLILDHRFKEWSVKLKARISRSRRLSEPPYCMHYIAIGIYSRLSCIIDLTGASLVRFGHIYQRSFALLFLVSLPVVICWTKFVHKASELLCLAIKWREI